MTRAIALRMVHAGTVATSPEGLDAWIAQTEDLRVRLTDAGYGSAFAAADLFPLFQAYVAKASPPAAVAPRAFPVLWLWIGAALVAGALVAFAVASR
jgi:hypothetical protein